MGAAAGVAVFSLVRGCLVATPLRELDPAGVRAFHAELSARLQHERGLHGVVLDVSAVEVMDADDFGWVRGTLQLAALMGARAVLAGVSPEVAATLVRLDVDVSDVQAAHTVDLSVDALEHGP